MEPRVTLAALAARIRPFVQRLPMQPPALALAAALNHWLTPRLPGGLVNGFAHARPGVEWSPA